LIRLFKTRTHTNDEPNKWITKKKEFHGRIRIRRGHEGTNDMIREKGAEPIPFHKEQGHAL